MLFIYITKHIPIFYDNYITTMVKIYVVIIIKKYMMNMKIKYFSFR